MRHTTLRWIQILLGLEYCLHNPDRKIKILIQALSSLVSSVLDAEAQALLLAVQAVEKLGWTGVSYLSDNKNLVQAASLADDLLSGAGHWLIRPTVAVVLKRREQFSEEVLKVPRAENKMAHALAKRAIRDQSDSRSLFRCKSIMVFVSLCFCRT